MKSELSPSPSSGITYPCLFESVTKTYFVVLATDVSTGTIVYSESTDAKIGIFHTDFIDFTNENEWQPLEKGRKIILSNNQQT